MKPILILQLRTIDEAADGEYNAFLKYGGLSESEVERVRMEKESFARLKAEDFAGIIVGGGPSNVSDSEGIKPGYQLRFEKELNQLYRYVFEFDIPYLGSCYGLGSLVKFKGGVVSKEKYSEEVGITTVELTKEGMDDPLLKGLPSQFVAFCGHKEACQTTSTDAAVLGTSTLCPVQIVRFKNNIYATQFHCELDASGIAQRIDVYRNHGYFRPEEAESLIEKTSPVTAPVPQEMLRRFIERCRILAREQES